MGKNNIYFFFLVFSLSSCELKKSNFQNNNSENQQLNSAEYSNINGAKQVGMTVYSDAVEAEQVGMTVYSDAVGAEQVGMTVNTDTGERVRESIVLPPESKIEKSEVIQNTHNPELVATCKATNNLVTTSLSLEDFNLKKSKDSGDIRFSVAPGAFVDDTNIILRVKETLHNPDPRWANVLYEKLNDYSILLKKNSLNKWVVDASDKRPSNGSNGFMESVNLNSFEYKFKNQFSYKKKIFKEEFNLEYNDFYLNYASDENFKANFHAKDDFYRSQQNILLMLYEPEIVQADGHSSAYYFLGMLNVVNDEVRSSQLIRLGDYRGRSLLVKKPTPGWAWTWSPRIVWNNDSSEFFLPDTEELLYFTLNEATGIWEKNSLKEDLNSSNIEINITANITNNNNVNIPLQALYLDDKNLLVHVQDSSGMYVLYQLKKDKNNITHQAVDVDSTPMNLKFNSAAGILAVNKVLNQSKDQHALSFFGLNSSSDLIEINSTAYSSTSQNHFVGQRYFNNFVMYEFDEQSQKVKSVDYKTENESNYLGYWNSSFDKKTYISGSLSSSYPDKKILIRTFCTK